MLDYRRVESNLLKNSEWENQSVEQILLRLPGALKKRRRIGGMRAYCLLIPEEILAKFIGDEHGKINWSRQQNNSSAWNQPNSASSANKQAGKQNAYEPQSESQMNLDGI